MDSAIDLQLHPDEGVKRESDVEKVGRRHQEHQREVIRCLSRF